MNHGPPAAPAHRESCCAPSRATSSDRAAVATIPSGGDGARHGVDQALVPGGVFDMGDHSGDGQSFDGERPLHTVELDSFGIDATTVSNDDFARFVDATGYVTEAETFGFSAVFHLTVAADRADIIGQSPGTPWWLGVNGADWRHPSGRHSTIDDLGDHPAVHVSWNDAHAYCAWTGRRLPTEAEWEYASRGGLSGLRYPWGDDLLDEYDSWQCNIWQGTFPTINTEDDGWLTTAPVRSYRPNGYGVWQMVGNVWEWCSDWMDHRYYTRSSRRNPPGPGSGSTRVMRGGSFLCHDSYCNRYRNAARTSNTPDSSAANISFRTVAR